MKPKNKKVKYFTLLLFASFIVFVSSCGVALNSENEDPLFSSQWGFYNDGSGEDVDIKAAEHDEVDFVEGIDINAKELWEEQKKRGKQSEDKEVIVAIIDTEVDFNHEDLDGTQWKNKNEIPDDGIDNDKNGYKSRTRPRGPA
jgi:hypothetical protein